MGSDHGVTGGPEGSAPGLDPYRQSCPREEGPEPDDGLGDGRCINPPPFAFLNLATGEVVPARCGRNRCNYCAQKNAWKRSLAIAWAQPRRALTITLAAPAGSLNPWQDARHAVNLTRRNLKRLGIDPGEWLYHVEPNPKRTGFHVHAWQHGPRLPKEALQEASHRAGAGWTRVEAIRQVQNVGAYGLKGLGYGLKGLTDGATGYLEVNGGRLTHQSRGYFRGLGVRDAEKAAMGESEGQWVITTLRA